MGELVTNAATETATATTDAAPDNSPVYVSFRTIINLIERMEREGIPTQIDKSYLSNLAGGYQSQVLLALRSLDLIGPNYEVRDLLRDIVTKPSERKVTFKTLVERLYPWALELGTTATQLQLNDAFKAHGERLGANTREKAITFYLQAAQYAGIRLSPFFKGNRPSTNGSEGPAPSRPRPPRRRGRPTKAGSEVPAAEAPRPPAPPASSDEERKDAYFKLLVEKAQKSDGQGDKEILDRIERLLGMPEAAPKGTKA